MLCTTAILLGSCGRIGFDKGNAEQDGAILGEIDGGTESDSGSANQPDATIAQADPWDGPFTMSAPTHESGLSSANGDIRCAFDATGHELFLASGRPPSLGGNDIFLASRLQVSDSFTSAAHVTTLAGPHEDGRFHPFDATHAVFHSAQPGGVGGIDIWSLTRSNESADWVLADAVNETNLNSTTHDTDPWVSPDGKRIYFVSIRAGGEGSHDIYTASRSSLDERFGAPSLMAGLSTVASETSPTLSPDQLFIVIDKPSAANAHLDLVYARRSSIDLPFGEVQPLPVINSSSGDVDGCIGVDGDFYFSSDRPGAAGGGGDFDIYRTRFLPISGK